MKKFLLLMLVFLLTLAIILITSACSSSNMTALREALNRRVDEEQYTAPSFAAYQNAREAALAVYQDGGATSTRIREATAALNRAFNSLVLRADFSVLGQLLSVQRNATDYSRVSFDRYIETRQRAQAVYNNTQSRQSEIDAHVRQLNQAISNLQPTTSNEREQLGDLIAQYRNPGTNFTSHSLAALREAIALGESIYNNSQSSSNMISLAANGIQNAVNALEPLGNLGALNAAIAHVRNEHLSNLPDGRTAEQFYTPQSFAAFTQVYENANVMVSDNDSVQFYVDQMVESLLSAASALVEQDTSIFLHQAIASADNYIDNPDRYTDATFSALLAAVTQAEQLLDAENATWTQINSAVNAITSAINRLVRREIESDGHENHNLATRPFTVGNVSVTPYEHFNNPTSILDRIAGLSQVTSQAVVSERTVFSTSNGIDLVVGDQTFQAVLASGRTAPAHGPDLATVMGVNLSFGLFDITDVNGNPTTYTTVTLGGQLHSRLTYIDQPNGIEIIFEFNRVTDQLVRIAVNLIDTVQH